MNSILKYGLTFIAVFAITGIVIYSGIRMFTKSAEEVIIPELKGKNIIYVLETLTRMGLNAKLHGTQYDEDLPRYAVLSQDPAPGSTIKKGRDVIIYISKGKKETVMPDLRQVPLEQALLLLEKNEFKTGHISYTYSSKTMEKRIMEQLPQPFSNAFKGTECKLLVSRGSRPAELAMPDLTGTSLDSSSSIADEHNIKIAKIISDINLDKEHGIILSQTPEPGAYVTSKTPATIVVNSSEKNRTIPPEQLKESYLVSFKIPDGILKSHVRIETDHLGPFLDIYNKHMKPGQIIRLLIPAGNKIRFNIFIDHTIFKTLTIDPWKRENLTGENTKWLLSPLQFYQQISQN